MLSAREACAAGYDLCVLFESETLMRPGTASLTLGLSLLLCGCSQPQDSVDERSAVTADYAYVNATLIDGTERPPLPDATVLVKGDLILDVGPSDKVDTSIADEVIDASGMWIVPGLIDAHAHFMESGRIYTKPGQFDLTHLVSYEEEVAWMQQRVPITLQGYLCAGVTSVLSVGGPSFEYEVREQAEGLEKAPNVFVAHGPITLVPAEILFPPFDGDMSVRTAADAEHARSVIQQGVEWGADFVKTGYLGGPFAEYEVDYVSLHEAIVDEAHANNLKVTTHVTELEPTRILVELGVDSLQHLPLDAPMDESLIASIKSNGTVVVPTLAVWPRSFVHPYDYSYDFLSVETRCGDPQVIESLYEVEDLGQLPDEFKESLILGIGNASETVRRLVASGVTLATGSDAGNIGLIHGASLHYEIKLMHEAGVPALEVIRAATLNAARVAGKEGLVGSIEPGKLADFLILDNNPLSDISNLSVPMVVVKGGNIFAQEELLPPHG